MVIKGIRDVSLSNPVAEVERVFAEHGVEFDVEDPPAEYYAYVLECQRPQKTTVSAAYKACTGRDYVPEDIEKANAWALHYRLIYIGQTNDIVRRLREHGTGEGAESTFVFPPKRLLEVRVAATREDAKRIEDELLLEYNEDRGFWPGISGY